MNNNYIQDLTSRLSQALDQNYDVVNMEAVLSVISALEGTTITKEQLEATRLAKFINQLRRRTKSEQLARRAKSLLKIWREMVGIQQQQPLLESLAIQPAITSKTESSGNITTVGPSNATSFRETKSRCSISQQQLSVTMPTTSNAATATPLTFCYLQTVNTNSNLTNSSTASLTSSANITNSNNNNYNSCSVNNKRSDFVTIKSSATDGAQLQQKHQEPPTSFAHILSKFCRSNNKSDNTPLLTGFEVASSFKNADISQSSRHVSPLCTHQLQETLVIDQSFTNINGELQTVDIRNQEHLQLVDTIVIDIQDSNSVPDIITSTKTASINTKIAPNKTPPPIIIRPGITTPAPKTNSSCSSNGNKKTRKEKKRFKGQLPQHSLRVSCSDNVFSSWNDLCYAASKPLFPLVIDEISSSQQYNKSIKTQDLSTFRPLSEEKTTVRTIPVSYRAMSDISEILSLSNSSMSSMFPNELVSTDLPRKAEGPAALQQKSNKRKDNRPLNESECGSVTTELTFAGKFTQQTLDSAYNNCSISNLPLVTLNKPLQFPSLSDGGGIICNNNMGGNSNDSTSTNSRLSQFDPNEGLLNASIDTNKLEHPAKVSQDNLQLLSNMPITNTNLTQSHLQSQILTVNDNKNTIANVLATTHINPIPAEKIPKKRGRKKGSRGIDSVIAKETSLTSQMLKSSLGNGGKKVKTTKELYAEMQNRKLTSIINPATVSLTTSTNTITHQQLPLSFVSRPTSSCSEPSLLSPHVLDNFNVIAATTRSTPEQLFTHTVELNSDSDTLTSGDLSRDSMAATRVRQRACSGRNISIDSNSNSQLPQYIRTISDTKRQIGKQQDTLTVTLKEQLKHLLLQLPTVRNIAELEAASAEEQISCTCNILELIPEKQKAVIGVANDIGDNSQLQANDKTEDRQQIPFPTIIVDRMDTKLTSAIDNATDTTIQISKPKKSIFDLDFDDDDDPLHKIVAEAAALKHRIKTEKIVAPIEKTLERDTISNEMDANQLNRSIDDSSTAGVLSEMAFDVNNLRIQQIMMPIYQFVEDPDCVAKQHFELQTQQITAFHVNALHNCFIPNVNGNWDDADCKKKFATKTKRIDIGKTELRHLPNVVPKYGSLVLNEERIHKDLNHVIFTPNFKPKMRDTILLTRWKNAPFLGVVYEHDDPIMKNRVAFNTLSQQMAKPRQNQYANCSKSKKQDPIKHVSKNAQATNALSASISAAFVSTRINSYVGNNFDTVLENIAFDNPINQDTLPPINSAEILCNGRTVDVTTKNSDDVKPSALNSNNLLIKADAANISPVAIAITNYLNILPDAIDNVGEKTKESQIKEDVYGDEEVFTNSSFHNINCADIKLDDVNTSSRRSSSCSNSSLKQTQQSINVKLRRHRMLMQQLRQTSENFMDDGGDVDCVGRKRKKQKEKYKKIKKLGKVEQEKPRFIKRLKIAINGDVATHRQITMDSSNNSASNTDDEGYPNSIFRQATNADRNNLDDISHRLKRHASEKEDEFDYGALRSLQKKKHKKQQQHISVTKSDEDNYQADMDEIDNDEEVDIEHKEAHVNCYEHTNNTFEEDEDLYDEDDDKEDKYTVDYHEVVTRDILPVSNATGGNNHIVLTIKKTPSKTNSPTNSTLCSVMSPLVVAQISSTAVASQTRASISSHEQMTPSALPMELCTSSGTNKCGNIVGFGIHEAVNSPTADTTTNRMIQEEFHKRNISGVSKLYNQLKLRRRRVRRKTKLPKAFRFPDQTFPKNAVDKAVSDKIKVHRKLFFHSELCRRNSSSLPGEKEDILHIASCSSSCSEGHTDFEYYVSSSSSDSFCSYKNGHTSNKKNRHKRESEAIQQIGNNGEKSVCRSDDVRLTSKEDNYASTEDAKKNREHEKHNAEYVKTQFEFIKLDQIKNEVENKEEPKESSLPLENNGLLLSFNNIYYTESLRIPTATRVNPTKSFLLKSSSLDDTYTSDAAQTTETNQLQELKQQLKLSSKNKNCDVYNNLLFSNYADNNNGNITLIKNTSNNDNQQKQIDEMHLHNFTIQKEHESEANITTAEVATTATNDIGKNSCNKHNVYNNSNVNRNVNSYTRNITLNSTLATTTITTVINNIILNNGSNSGADNCTIDSKEVIQKQLSPPTTNMNGQLRQIPYREYSTGLRAVDEDVADDDGNTFARLQHFKEWYEVLQLRSYNDELLTVLPYVVLE